MKKIILVTGLLVFSTLLFAQQPDPFYKDSVTEALVDRMYKAMTLDEKIGQLFMMRIPSEFNEENKKLVDHYLEDLHLGGVGYLKGHPTDHLLFNNYINQKAKIPPIIAIDAEWGLAMRLDSVLPYPWFMTLGAVGDDALIERIGRRMGEQLRALGYNMNYSPDVDINTNPENPIIGNRSFGEDKYNVARKAYAIMRGMQSLHVLNTAKHFPGHGDTSQDSHKTLPTVNFSKERIDSVELYPYKFLIPRDLTGVMVAHLRVPALDYTGIPSTLSHPIVHDILKVQLGFKGLILTDAMVMKGVADYTYPWSADLRAFLAGNDIILFSKDIDRSIAYFKEAYKKGIITEKRLAESVKKILKAKMWAGAFERKILPLNRVKDISVHMDTVLTYEAYEKAITLVKNRENILPFSDITRKYAYVPLGERKDKDSVFYKFLNKYVPIDRVPINGEDDLKKLKAYDFVIIGLLKNTDNPWKPYRISPDDKKRIEQISREKPSVLVVFTSPYSLGVWKNILPAQAVVVAYQNNVFTQKLVPQLLFGALPFQGKLPVSVNEKYKVNHGIVTTSLKRLSYAYPEQVGMDSRKLRKVDSLMQVMTDTMAAPGAVVLAARHGRIFFHKAYGYQTYDSIIPMQKDFVFDVASVTKVLSATSSMMRIYDEGGFKLTQTLGELLPYLRGSNKDTLDIISVLSHYARIKSWIPYYLSTIDSVTHEWLPGYYSKVKKPGYEIKVAENMFLISTYPDTIWQKIKEAPQYKERKYVYSGLPFYLWVKFLKDTYGYALDQYVDSVFYKPMGAFSLTYNAWKKFHRERIVPSEVDDYWRHQELRGYVHDMGAAMLGGVSGNAGLFGDAEDLAKMMQMHLQKGYYGGKRYISEKTENLFNKRYFEKDSVRRGLGWDKPQFKGHLGPTFEEISPKSFGHLGFTGTMVWADPEEDIVYIFLSNRTWPKMANPLLSKLNIRSETQRLIYLAIINPKHDYRDQYKVKGIPYPWEKKNGNHNSVKKDSLKTNAQPAKK